MSIGSSVKSKSQIVAFGSASRGPLLSYDELVTLPYMAQNRHRGLCACRPVRPQPLVCEGEGRGSLAAIGVLLFALEVSTAAAASGSSQRLQHFFHVLLALSMALRPYQTKATSRTTGATFLSTDASSSSNISSVLNLTRVREPSSAVDDNAFLVYTKGQLISGERDEKGEASRTAEEVRTRTYGVPGTLSVVDDKMESRTLENDGNRTAGGYWVNRNAFVDWTADWGC
ncbi:hypothetical protein BC567DRAFT_252879 [Phyllosticta citribraziliensis]